ncbi:TetR family transcriptional regulator [Superficieibacter electus]|uniref:TetR family transcriptional regulator n=1 Tax=Superficieibacter electus TaxID=2022662 RepID=A0A2P5GUX9_9ENTR|nr:TetR/AcrR family transcriptional regulator [Superficieibacter electus]POP44349.1 TetR family transcriptional regulator [Superficieibacter electus]POP50367.1 TetR family transcriptional regulator [Superficieibacter electus]
MKNETGLRADAQRNRERILAAAETLFLERGAGASLEEVAKRAGVGIGTLYRRFPSREALLAATWNARLLAFAQASREGGERDPLNAMRVFLEGLVRHTQTWQGMASSLGTVLQSGTPGCQAITEEGCRLLSCGQQTGTLRSDITFDDIVYVITATSLTAEQENASATRIAHLIDLFLNGIHAR